MPKNIFAWYIVLSVDLKTLRVVAANGFIFGFGGGVGRCLICRQKCHSFALPGGWVFWCGTQSCSNIRSVLLLQNGSFSVLTLQELTQNPIIAAGLRNFLSTNIRLG
jgi:hypothetical protein